MSESFVPPYVTIPETVKTSIGLLRDSMICVIRTWPRAMYEDDLFEGPGGVLYVMKPELVHEVLVAQAENFPQSRILQRILDPVWRQGIAASKGAQWRDQRKKAAPAYTPQASLSVVPASNQVAEQLATLWTAQGKGQVELVSSFSAASITMLLRSLFDGVVDEGTEARLQALSSELSDQMSRLNYADLLRLPAFVRPLMGSTLRGPMNQIHDIVGAALAASSPRPVEGDSLLAILQSATQGDEDAAEQVRNNMVGSLIAGRENTALGMAWAMYMAAQDAALQARLVEEITNVVGDGPVEKHHIAALPLVQSHYLETLRLFPPAPQVVRDCVAESEIGGHRVKKGTMVNIPIYAIHRHASRWNDPHTFDVERFLPDRFDRIKNRYAYMPFGAGQRICMGLTMATAESVVVLANLLRAIRVSAPPFDPADLVVAASLRPANGLTISYEAR